MGNDALGRSAQGMLAQMRFDIQDLQTRLALSGRASLTRGSTAIRDAFFGEPITDEEVVALANQRPRWFNTDTNRDETFYAQSDLTGLDAPGLLPALANGWYAMPATEWAGKSGPASYAAAYRVTWSRGIESAGGTLDASTDGSRIQIGMDGVYECHAFLRGGPTGNAVYAALALDGDRAAFEDRSESSPGPMVGVWTHDHPGAENAFSQSHYIGELYAGDLITAGPYTSGTDMVLSSSASSGALCVRRIS